jgi:drug/metabolite transporter (DMT)-like permease
MTGVIGMLFLRDERMTMLKLTGMLCGVLGLYWIFAADIEVGPRDYLGILAVLLSVLLHSVSAVWVKRVHAELPALTTTTGALLLVLPLYFLTWLLVDGEPPAEITWRASVSLLYLGVFGSVVGFILFYYVLKHLEASRVALITLITPVFALGLGMLLNAERLTLEMAWGIGGILLGLAIYQWGDVLLEKNRPRGPSSI